MHIESVNINNGYWLAQKGLGPEAALWAEDLGPLFSLGGNYHHYIDQLAVYLFIYLYKSISIYRISGWLAIFI